MKSLSEYIYESLHVISDNEKGIIVFDIDDTLVKADKKAIGIIKFPRGDRKNPVRLSTEEYAKDPDSKTHRDWFSYEEFSDPFKVVKSIINGTPMLRNLHIMDRYIRAGYAVTFLTARGCEDAVKYALTKFLEYRDGEGKLHPIGNHFNMKAAAAVNDLVKKYDGETDPEKKSNVLRGLCSEYDYVVFVDDDIKNVEMAKGLGLRNLRVIQAKK